MVGKSFPSIKFPTLLKNRRVSPVGLENQGIVSLCVVPLPFQQKLRAWATARKQKNTREASCYILWEVEMSTKPLLEKMDKIRR